MSGIYVLMFIVCKLFISFVIFRAKRCVHPNEGFLHQIAILNLQIHEPDQLQKLESNGKEQKESKPQKMTD